MYNHLILLELETIHGVYLRPLASSRNGTQLPESAVSQGVLFRRDLLGVLKMSDRKARNSARIARGDHLIFSLKTEI
jgi:hypothetical protein